MQNEGKQTPVSRPDSNAGSDKNRQTGSGPEPENPAYDKKLDGPNRPSV
jgi:hypothetical protein